MSGRPNKQVHPAASALFIMLTLAGVQWVWWRFLVVREAVKPGAGGPAAPMNMTASVNLVGRTDVPVISVAGDQMPGSSDGPGHAARFDRPTGLAIDAAGNLYVADTGNNRIRRISPERETTTLAGGEAGFLDGPADQARFNAPCGLCVGPDQSVYVADTGNHCIRRILNGQVSTFVGRPANASAAVASPLASANLFTSVAFMQSPKPGLLAADAGSGQLQQYDSAGLLTSKRGTSGRPLSVSGPPQAAAISDAGLFDFGGQTVKNVPIQLDSPLTAELAGKLSLRHPVGLCRMGDGWLVTDKDFGAVLLVSAGKAQVIAGYCSSSGPVRGNRDGNGATCLLGTLCGVVSDGKQYAYFADTSNNLIRRLDISALLAH